MFTTFSLLFIENTDWCILMVPAVFGYFFCIYIYSARRLRFGLRSSRYYFYIWAAFCSLFAGFCGLISSFAGLLLIFASLSTLVVPFFVLWGGAGARYLAFKYIYMSALSLGLFCLGYLLTEVGYLCTTNQTSILLPGYFNISLLGQFFICCGCSLKWGLAPIQLLLPHIFRILALDAIFFVKLLYSPITYVLTAKLLTPLYYKFCPTLLLVFLVIVLLSGCSAASFGLGEPSFGGFLGCSSVITSSIFAQFILLALFGSSYSLLAGVLVLFLFNAAYAALFLYVDVCADLFDRCTASVQEFLSLLGGSVCGTHALLWGLSCLVGAPFFAAVYLEYLLFSVYLSVDSVLGLILYALFWLLSVVMYTVVFRALARPIPHTVGRSVLYLYGSSMPLGHVTLALWVILVVFSVLFDLGGLLGLLADYLGSSYL